MKGSFYDIKKAASHYTYLYVLIQKRGFFKKTFYKMTLKSDLPHYWFTDIWHVLEIKMNQCDFLWHDILNKNLELPIGTLNIREFSPNDTKEINCSKSHLNDKLDIALDKAQKFKTKYEQENGGHPDLNMPPR